MTELSERESRILRAIVTEYIDTGQPVGSRTLSRKYELGLSPATIRNVLSDLEEAGYLYQPHTSAGRLPTETAFRLFVAELMTASSLSVDEAQEIDTLDGMEPGLELLRESGRILSKLANAATVVVAPRAEARRLSQLRFIVANEPAPGLLAVIMFADGSVETRFVEVDKPPQERDLERIHNVLAKTVRGKTLQQVRDDLASFVSQERSVAGDPEARAATLGLQATVFEPEQPLVVIEGRARLLDQLEFADTDRLRDLSQVLDEREQLVLLLDRTLSGRTLSVLVGTETGNLARGELSIVAAPFARTTSRGGAIGVLGPKRMNYAKVVSLVSATAKAVSAAHDRATRSGGRLGSSSGGKPKR